VSTTLELPVPSSRVAFTRDRSTAAAGEVLTSRHGVEVVRPYAGMHSAEVVEIKTVGDGSDDQLVGHPVRRLLPLVPFGAPVPVPVRGAGPEPTGAELGALLRQRAVTIDFAPEPFDPFLVAIEAERTDQEQRVAVMQPSVVVHGAEPLAVPLALAPFDLAHGRTVAVEGGR
jgi:hypothetical protein